jgi:hypothetical protein
MSPTSLMSTPFVGERDWIYSRDDRLFDTSVSVDWEWLTKRNRTPQAALRSYPNKLIVSDWIWAGKNLNCCGVIHGDVMHFCVAVVLT